MLLAKDLNGRRIYSSKSDLEAALNVSAILTAEQFENKVKDNQRILRKSSLVFLLIWTITALALPRGGKLPDSSSSTLTSIRRNILLKPGCVAH